MFYIYNICCMCIHITMFNAFYERNTKFDTNLDMIGIHNMSNSFFPIFSSLCPDPRIKSKSPISRSSFADVQWCKYSCLASFQASFAKTLQLPRWVPIPESLLSCIWAGWINSTPSEWIIVYFLPFPIDKSHKWFTTDFIYTFATLYMLIYTKV